MFWLKHCPRCNGDLFNSTDIYGDYIACLQCGHYLTGDQERAMGFLPSEKLNMACQRTIDDVAGFVEEIEREAVLVS